MVPQEIGLWANMKDKLYIGIVAYEFPPDIGGVETYSYEFAKELVKQGYKVTVFTRKHKEEVKLEGVEIQPVLQACRKKDRQILQDSSIDAWHQ
jgi:glycogen synthase